MSEKTKSFYYLLQKYKGSREDIIRVTRMCYFDEKNFDFSSWKGVKDYKNDDKFNHHNKKNLWILKKNKKRNSFLFWFCIKKLIIKILN